MGGGCISKLALRAMFLVGAAAMGYGLKQEDQPLTIRLIVAAGFFAMVGSSTIISHLRWLEFKKACDDADKREPGSKDDG